MNTSSSSLWGSLQRRNTSPSIRKDEEDERWKCIVTPRLYPKGNQHPKIHDASPEERNTVPIVSRIARCIQVLVVILVALVVSPLSLILFVPVIGLFTVTCQRREYLSWMLWLPQQWHRFAGQAQQMYRKGLALIVGLVMYLMKRHRK